MTQATCIPASPGPFARLVTALRDRTQARRRRQRFLRLLDMDDHMLDDMGVTRAEVVEASYLPLSANAATELYRMSLERRRNFM
ncbi:DUF1127 domain-containing protein [Alphaproteobacteria bacterium GH1-50]|uniref:DUF1127 domain-containing protein n=1 Tax=Kangsaoukella pontilimi TaxID=2691042 RepID=A0A7C9IS07_9RHOB|nr:DUF1127 domain-containing protein [Kangsaoukella pontilimi]MXQ08146.1 DUF1127 domain-containing protein [Kangsaoukella pontilimi]